MSTKLKFRTWDGRRMLYWGFLEGGAFSAPPSPSNHKGMFEMPQMQYTGLRDKNGVMIYEGDIVRDKLLFSMAFSENYYERENIYEVKIPDIYMCWGESQFPTFKELKKYFSQGNKKLGVEVIGNIMENKELLK